MGVPTRDDAEVLRTRLEGFLASSLPDGACPRVCDLRRSETGTSRENWSFKAAWLTDGERIERDLLLRRDPAAGVVETGRLAEFQLLDRLSRTGFPAPEVLWLDESGAHLGRPGVIMRRYPGRAHRAVLRKSDPLGIGADQQARLATDMCGLLARLHELDVAASGVVDAIGEPPANPAAAELGRWVAELDAAELEPQPALRMAVGWMRDHVPSAPERQVVVHGDFRPGNVLVEDGRVSALLDWELAHLGDPADDLGWYTCRIYTDEHFIPGRWPVKSFLERYQAETGAQIEAGRLRFWQVLSAFRLTVMALTGIRAFCAGAGDRPARSADWLSRIVLQSILAVEGE
jgi:aminoglycoside phosphotransferase (APT) family kinase protein